MHALQYNLCCLSVKKKVRSLSWEDASYLLETHVSNEFIAEVDADVMHFTQPSGKWPI